MSSSLEVALLAAFVTFIFGLLLLVVREALERHRERLKGKRELLSLIDLYLGEIASGLDRCVQYVRQVYLGEVSRSRLSILIGSSKFDRLATLHVRADVLSALHDIYRMFDLVQNQVEKYRPDEFQAIPAFVLGDYHVVMRALDTLTAYARSLHGAGPEVIGRRLLSRALQSIARIRAELLFGVAKDDLDGRKRFDSVLRRIDRFASDLMNWVVANSLAHNIAFGKGDVRESWIIHAQPHSKTVIARVVRCLAAALKAIEYGSRRGDRNHSDLVPGIIEAGNRLSGLNVQGESIMEIIDTWRLWWINQDIEFVDN